MTKSLYLIIYNRLGGQEFSRLSRIRRSIYTFAKPISGSYSKAVESLLPEYRLQYTRPESRNGLLPRGFHIKRLCISDRPHVCYKSCRHTDLDLISIIMHGVEYKLWILWESIPVYYFCNILNIISFAFTVLKFVKQSTYYWQHVLVLR